MNARPTEFRRASDLRAQRELESLLAARHAATAAREARYRRLRTPLSESREAVPTAAPAWLAWTNRVVLSIALTALAWALAAWALPLIRGLS